MDLVLFQLKYNVFEIHVYLEANFFTREKGMKFGK